MLRFAIDGRNDFEYDIGYTYCVLIVDIDIG